MLNSTQVKQLFEREAILIGTADGVPVYRAAEVFGHQAAQFACNPSEYLGSTFGIGDFQLDYLTYRGFQQAASYANVEEIARVQGRESVSSSDGNPETGM